MKPGSLVVCLNIGIPLSPFREWVKWLPIMDENTPYIIRQMDKDITGAGVKFEEGILGYNNNGSELIFPIEYVREIQAPSIEEITEVVRDAQENYSLIEK